ncbi:hypothetical protein [Roseovarius sp. D0-M9]|uniref:hypothetical protein n=1 Tax=Roseovarius sp. D0-M9 TaxID=3127117 RepID=UPI00300FB81E
MSDFLTSTAFQQSFWLFLGVVAGALIQFLFHYIISRSQRGKAKKLFLVEIEINAEVLKTLEAEILRKKSRFVSGQQNEYDFNFDFSDFNYRMVDPLINTGHFHQIVGAVGVKSYFTFMNNLNVQSQMIYKNLLGPFSFRVGSRAHRCLSRSHISCLR